jgi:hypothetical protein
MIDHQHSAASYQRLRRLGETCPECKAAVAAAARERRAARKATAPAAPEAAPDIIQEDHRPGNMPSEFYKRDPRETTPEEDELEIVPTRRPPDEGAPGEPDEGVQPEPAAPEPYVVAGAVVAHGQMEGYADERFRAPKIEYEEIPSDHRAVKEQTYIGPIETRAQRRRRNRGWTGRQY